MNIEKFCEKYNFGNILNISKLSGGLMHKMFNMLATGLKSMDFSP